MLHMPPAHSSGVQHAKTMLGAKESGTITMRRHFLVAYHSPLNLHHAGGLRSMNIRYLAAAALMAVGLTAGSLAPTAAQAMPMPGPAVPAGAITSPLQAEQVRLVCKRVWTGRHWSRRCYETRPRAHRHYRYDHRHRYDRRHRHHRYYR